MASNTITWSGNALIIEPVGLDKMWSLTKKLEIPLPHLCGATIDSGVLNESVWRTGGLRSSGKWAGYFTKDGEKFWYNVTRGEEAVVIQLKDEKLDRLVLGVENPDQFVDEVNAVV